MRRKWIDAIQMAMYLFLSFMHALTFQGGHVFLLVEKNNRGAYTFSAKTDEMRRKWIDAIQMAMYLIYYIFFCYPVLFS